MQKVFVDSAAGHAPSLHKAAKQKCQKASLVVLSFPIQGEDEYVLLAACMNRAGCFSQGHTCWRSPASCLASVGWSGPGVALYTWISYAYASINAQL